MKTGMQKCSFFDYATGIVVQLNSISEEGEIKIKEPLASKDADGGERFAGHHSRIEITGYDDAGYDQLKTWMDNETPLMFVSYGLEGHILWYRETKITVKKNIFIPPGKSNSFTVVMEQKGGDHSGFDGNQIWYGQNLLYGAIGWEDVDGDGHPDRFTIEDTLNANFVTGVLSCNNVGVVAETVNKSTFFAYPISNVKLKGKYTYIVTNTTAALQASIIAFVYPSVPLLWSSGTDEQTIETPSNVWKLKVNIISNIVVEVGEDFSIGGYNIVNSNTRYGGGF